MGGIRRITEYMMKHGVAYTLHRLAEMAEERILHTTDREFRRHAASASTLSFQRENQPDAGLISVIVPVYNTRPGFLQELCASLQAQTYSNWEAILYDGCSTTQETIAALHAIQDKRIRVVFGSQNEGISGNTNRAVEFAAGNYYALCDHDDLLAPEALWLVAERIVKEQPELVYTDEDKLTENGRIHTSFHEKPDFCPDNLRSSNYICHLTVLKRSLWQALGGMRGRFDGSQDHDLVLRASEMTNRICHIPRVLYHWRTVGTSVSHRHLNKCLEAAANAVEEHLLRIGFPGECWIEDGVLRLSYKIDESIRYETIHLHESEGAREINRYARESTTDVLLFVGSSVRNTNDNFVNELLMYAQREDVGAVTPLLHDRYNRIVHAGFAVSSACEVVSRNAGMLASAGGWHGMNRTSYNVSAVSGECFMVRRSLLQDHPLDENMKGGYSLVDWCLKMQMLGFHHVFTPHAKAYCRKNEWLVPSAARKQFVARWQGYHDPCLGKSARGYAEFTCSQ